MTKKRNNRKNLLTAVYATSLVIAFIVVAAVAAWQYATVSYRSASGECYLYIPKNISRDAMTDSLKKLDEDFGSRVSTLFDMMNGNVERAHGAYLVDRNTTALNMARRLKNGRQSPVKVTFNNLRTMGQLADRVASQLEFNREDFFEACDSVLPEMGFKKSEYPAAFFPDTYEFYWTAAPVKVVEMLAGYRNKFWNEERRLKARELGLTPVGVATIASIVEEESAKGDERPTIARLYINRLQRGMPLQADPTVKFATGDFSLRRIGTKHLAIESPYNTYRNKGLPPVPIRIVERRTLEQVLDAPVNNYLYMCAKEDFSGYHNFASDFATHKQNARRYQQELNRLGIN